MIRGWGWEGGWEGVRGERGGLEQPGERVGNVGVEPGGKGMSRWMGGGGVVEREGRGNDEVGGEVGDEVGTALHIRKYFFRIRIRGAVIVTYNYGSKSGFRRQIN
jgi:hypothetical protein